MQLLDDLLHSTMPRRDFANHASQDGRQCMPSSLSLPKVSKGPREGRW
jgi:hypothetical protein